MHSCSVFPACEELVLGRVLLIVTLNAIVARHCKIKVPESFHNCRGCLSSSRRRHLWNVPRRSVFGTFQRAPASRHYNARAATTPDTKFSDDLAVTESNRQ